MVHEPITSAVIAHTTTMSTGTVRHEPTAGPQRRW